MFFLLPPRGPVGRWRLWSAGVLFRDLMTSKPGLGLLLYDVPPQALKDDDSKEDCDLDAHHPCELTVKSCDIKNDDTYENFASKTSKTRTVTRIARLTPAFIKNDDIYENFASRVLKNKDSHEDCDPRSLALLSSSTLSLIGSTNPNADT